MKHKIVLFTVTLCAALQVCGQTLSETQMRNARATGYAIVAARNPGQIFSIYMIPWDGVNTLEQNANTQINSGWHAQAAIKGNFFNQAFNGSDFSQYSSVLLSQQDFDTYKSTGTQWWIVCSTLPPFSGPISTSNGNVGIGASNPVNKLQIGVGTAGYSGNDLLISNGNGSLAIHNDISHTYLFGNRDIAIRPGGGYMAIYANSVGNVGIGTVNPDFKLTVNGKIKAEEIQVVVDVPADYVFEKDYKLMPLAEVEKFVNAKKHLPGMPTAETLIKNGWQVGEMNNKLLEKIEELTLYMIALKKENEELKRRLEKVEMKK